MDAVLNWLWQGGVVAVAVFVALRLLERARANVRYLVCWAALLLIVVLPVIPWLNVSAPAPAAVIPVDAVVTLPDTWWTSSVLMLAAWAAWASIWTARFAWSLTALWRARTRSRAFPPLLESTLTHWSRVRSTGRRAALVVSDSVARAAVLGCGAPVIAVSPSLARTLAPGELDRVLVHEWAHVQRRDDIVNVLQIVIRIVAGWHPAVWWIDRRLHVEREIACDEKAVEITGAPQAYAECLLKVASVKSPGRDVLVASAIFSASGLRARITKLVTPSRAIAPVWSRSLATAAVSALCVMALAVGGLRLVEVAALAQPFASIRTASAPLYRIEPNAVPMLPAREEQARVARRAAVPAPSAQHPPAEERAPSAPATPASEPRLGLEADSIPPAAEETANVAVVSPTAIALHESQPQSSAGAVAPPPTPWSAAADQGVAIGKISKEAGVATAGFFSRVARRVAAEF